MNAGTALTAVEPMDVPLVERCKRGDREAWRVLHEEHYAFVARTARRLGTPLEEIDDVCQDAFLIAFRKIAGFSTGKLDTWLYRITANVVSARHRRRRVRQAAGVALAALQLGHREPAPLRDVERRDHEQAVAGILESMSAPKREVFALADLEELPADVIAERVGCPVATVRTRLHRARKEFARIARKRGLVP